jgi:plastocyanin
MQFPPAIGLLALLIGASASCNSVASPPADAAIDAPALPRVQHVNCPTNVAVEITEIVNPSTGEYAYSPNPAMIRAGGVVRFRSGTMHTTRSNERGLFEVDYGQTECFRFNTKETHNFNCTAHGFSGSIVVQ